MKSTTRDDLSVIRSFCSQPSSSIDVSYFQEVMTTSDHRPAVPSTSDISVNKSNDKDLSRNSDQSVQNQPPIFFDYLHEVVRGGHNSSRNTTMIGSQDGDNNDDVVDRSTTFRLDVSADTDGSLFFSARENNEPTIDVDDVGEGDGDDHLSADLLVKACDTATSACGGDTSDSPVTPAPFSCDKKTATTTPNTAWTEARSFVNGLLSPFSPFLKQPNIFEDGIVTDGDPKRLRNEYLQFVSLKPCRKVSVVIRVLPVPDGDDSSQQQQQHCVFPHYKEDRRPFLTTAAGKDDVSSPPSARFAPPQQSQHPSVDSEGNGTKKTPALRDMVVVNPTAFGRYIPSQVTMETARLVAQVARINTEDWARLYEYHHVMWPAETNENDEGSVGGHGRGVARSFDTMDSLSRAAAQDALLEHESSLLISLGKEASCIGNQENGLWPKILNHCQAIMETQAVITLSMVEVLENKPDSFRDLLLPHHGGGTSDTSRTITLRHNDMKGAVLEGLIQVSIDSMPALLESLYRRRRRKSSKSSSSNGGGTTAVIGILNLWKDAVSHELNKAPNAQITCVELATSALAVGCSRNESVVQRKSTVSLGQALRQLLLQESAAASKVVSIGGLGRMESGTPASATKASETAMLLSTTSYRETTLTKVLQRSMESSKIVVVGSISPLSKDHDQTVALLNYLRRLLTSPGQTASSPFPPNSTRGDYSGKASNLSPSATTTPQPRGKDAASSPPASTTTGRRTSPEENEKLQMLARSKGMLEKLVSDPRQRLAKLLKTSPPKKPAGTTLEFQHSYDDVEEDVEPINYMQGMHNVRVMDIRDTANSMSWEKHYPQPHEREPSFDDDDGDKPVVRDRLESMPESRGDATPKLMESPKPGQGRHLWHHDDDYDQVNVFSKPQQDDGWYSEEEIERALEEEIHGVGRLYPEDDFSDEEHNNKASGDTGSSEKRANTVIQNEDVAVDRLNDGHRSDEDKIESDYDVTAHQNIEEHWSSDLEPPQPDSVDAGSDDREELVPLEFPVDEEETNMAPLEYLGNEDEDGFPELLGERPESTFSRVINDHLGDEFHDDFEGGHPAADLDLIDNDVKQGSLEFDPFSSEDRAKEILNKSGYGEEDRDLHVIEFFDQDEDYLDQRGDNNGEDRSLTELEPIYYGDGDEAFDMPEQESLGLPEQASFDEEIEKNPVEEDSFPRHSGDDDVSLELRSPDEVQPIRAHSNSPAKKHIASPRHGQASRYTSFPPSDPENSEHSGDNDEHQTNYELPEAPIPLNGSMESSRWYSNTSPSVVIDDRRVQAGIRLPSPHRERSAFTNFTSPYSSRHNMTISKEISVLAAEREELHSTVEMLKDNLRKVTEDHDGHMQQYEEEVQQLYGKLDAAMDDKRSIERVAKEAINAQTSQLEEMKSLAAEREALRLKVETLKENLSKVSSNHEEHLQRYQREVDHLHSKLGKAVKAQRSLEKIADEAVAAHRSQVEETRLLSAERNELHYMVESLQENLKSISGDHATNVKKYQEEIRLLRTKLEETFEERRAVQTTADEARFAYESQSEQIRALSSERDELRSMLNSMKASMKKVAGDHNDQLERYKEEVRQLHSKLDGALSDKLAVEKTSDEARFANSDLERKVKNLEDELVAGRLRTGNIDDLRLKGEQKLVDLEKASLRMKATIDELENDRDLLRKQKRDDEANLKRLEAELKRQKTAAERIESSNARLESLNVEDQETIRQLREEIRTKDSDRFGLEQLQHELTRLKRDKDYLQNTVENRKVEYSEILRERENEIAEYKCKHSEVQKELELSQANLAAIVRTKEAVESQLKLGQDNMAKLSRQILARDESIDRLESSLVQLQSLRKEDQNLMRELNAEIRNKESEKLDLEHLQNELSRVKRDKDHLETLNAHRKAEYMEALGDRDEEIGEYKSKVEALEQQLLAGRIALTSSEQQKLESTKQMTALQETVSKLELEVHRRDESVNRLMSDLTQIESLRKEDQETIRELTSELRNKESEQVALDQLHHKLSRLKQDKDHLGRLMETRKEEYETFMKERANEVAEYKAQTNALQLQLEKARSDGARIISDADAQLKALRDVEINLVQNLDGRDRTIDALQLNLLKFKEEITAIRQRENSITTRADREIDNLKKQVSNLEAEYSSTKRIADEATSQVRTVTLAHRATSAELDRAKEEAHRQKIALGRLNDELDARQRDSLRSEEKIFQMEATLRRFQEEAKAKIGQLMGRHKDSASVLGEARNENRMLSNEMRNLERTVEKVRAERDACYKSLQTGRTKMAELMLKNNVHEIGSLFDVSPPKEEPRSRMLAPPSSTTSPSRRFVAPEIYITDYSIGRALSVRAEEIAACVAVSARNSIQESQDEASQLRSQIYRLEEERASEVIALKSKIRNLEQELTRQEIQDKYYFSNSGRRKQRHQNYMLDPAE